MMVGRRGELVLGEWIGEGTKALGLSGEVTDEPFDTLRRNSDPNTGRILTLISAK